MSYQLPMLVFDRCASWVSVSHTMIASAIKALSKSFQKILTPYIYVNKGQVLRSECSVLFFGLGSPIQSFHDVLAIREAI